MPIDIGSAARQAPTQQQWNDAAEGLANVLANVGRAAAGPLKRRTRNDWQVCANRGRVPQNKGTTAANSICLESRRLHRLGGAAQSALAFGFSGFSVGTDGLETAPGNAQTIECSLEVVGNPPGLTVRAVAFTFSGSASGVLADGAAELVTDPLYPHNFGLQEFPAGMQFYARLRRTVASAGMFVTRFASIQNLSGESTRLSNGAGASQVITGATGDLSTPSGGSSIFCCDGPNFIIGRAVSVHDIAILGLGDSILNGSNDTAFGGASDGSDGQGGWFTRGLFSVQGRAVPHTLMAFNGTSVYQAMVEPSRSVAFAKRRAYLKYHTHAVENYGTNDFGNLNKTAAETLINKQALWGVLRSGDSTIYHVTTAPIIPRVDTTDSYATVANQTPRTGYADAGGAFRKPLNDAVAAIVGSAGGPDALFDLNAVLADTTFGDRFKATGSANGFTDDGTHLTNSASALVAAAFTEYVETLA